MAFPQNIFIAIILALLTSFTSYKIYNEKHWLFKYMITINSIYIIFLFTASLSAKFVNSFEPNVFTSMFIVFYMLIFIPFYIPLGYFILKKVLSYEWDSKGLTYFIAVIWSFTVITLSLVALFIIGFYVFVYGFYGFAP